MVQIPIVALDFVENFPTNDDAMIGEFFFLLVT